MDVKHILLEAPGSQGTAVQSWDLSSALVATQQIQFFILVCTKFQNFAFVKDTQCNSGPYSFSFHYFLSKAAFIYNMFNNAVSNQRPQSAEQSYDSA
jgi:hypothetical protein